ncbi:hypothetical protein MMC14_006866 [Varicellaria rhodocarpa]|nr:hypothetical protein [Varicellaria rhodocarpa]
MPVPLRYQPFQQPEGQPSECFREQLPPQQSQPSYHPHCQPLAVPYYFHDGGWIMKYRMPVCCQQNYGESPHETSLERYLQTHSTGASSSLPSKVSRAQPFEVSQPLQYGAHPPLQYGAPSSSQYGATLSSQHETPTLQCEAHQSLQCQAPPPLQHGRRPPLQYGTHPSQPFNVPQSLQYEGPPSQLHAAPQSLPYEKPPPQQHEAPPYPQAGVPPPLWNGALPCLQYGALQSPWSQQYYQSTDSIDDSIVSASHLDSHVNKFEEQLRAQQQEQSQQQKQPREQEQDHSQSYYGYMFMSTTATPPIPPSTHHLNASAPAFIPASDLNNPNSFAPLSYSTSKDGDVDFAPTILITPEHGDVGFVPLISSTSRDGDSHSSTNEDTLSSIPKDQTIHTSYLQDEAIIYSSPPSLSPTFAVDSLPSPPPPRLPTPEHGCLHFTACYDDYCQIHSQAKDGTGYYPRKPKSRGRQWEHDDGGERVRSEVRTPCAGYW